jgi:hypothetical protein
MGEYCAAYFAGNPNSHPATMTCNPDYSVAMLGVVTRWTPVKNLTFSAEALWMHLNTAMSGTAVISPGSGNPAQAYTFANQDTISINVRAQRNF